MSFSAIARLMPEDQAGWGQWHLEHAREHRIFTGTLLAQSPPVSTTEYPIETMDDPEPWLRAHMEMSQSVWSGIGGGQSPELRNVDWGNLEQLQDWLLEHDRWHSQVRTTLGL